MSRIGWDVLTVLVLLGTALFAGDDLKPELKGGAIIVVVNLVFDGAKYYLQNNHLVRLWWQSYKPNDNKELRISIAYLFKIQVDDKYLLIRNHRNQNGYQPIGGVYKYFEPEGRDDLKHFGIEVGHTIAGIPIDGDSRNDLRCKMRDRRKLIPFLKWFEKGQNREIDPCREFYEELVEPGILTRDVFRHIQYKLIGKNYAPITYSQYTMMFEFLYADIYELKPVCREQQQHIEQLLQTPNSDLLFATEQEIMQGHAGDKHILPHTKKLFTSKL